MLDTYSNNTDLLFARDKVNKLDSSLQNFYRLDEFDLSFTENDWVARLFAQYQHLTEF